MKPNSIPKISPRRSSRVISKKLYRGISNQCGFTLFEFAISMMLSTMLMTAAFTIYNQVNKGAATVQKITTYDTKIMIVKDRLGADFQGISPLWFTPELYEKLKEAQKTEAKDAAKTQAPQSKNKQNNFLYAQSSDKVLDFLTFVTTNPLQMYAEGSVRFVRVIYKLTPDAQDKSLFKLMRKEDKKPSADFDIEKLKEGTFYELANNITKISIEFGYIDHSKKEDANKKLSFVWKQKWDSKKNDQQEDTKKKDDDKRPDLPEAIKLKISFLHEVEKPEIDYELFFMIPINQEQGLKSFAEKRAQAEPKAKSPTPTNNSPGAAAPGPAVPGAAIANPANLNISATKIQPPLQQPGDSHA